MAGREVTRRDLDARVAEAILQVRDAVQRINVVAGFLKTVPKTAPGGDPLTRSTEPVDPMDSTSASGSFGYTEDEAALIRSVFEQLQALNASLGPILANASRLTGLE